ncbi:MAG TPA: D-cysteine desulfhydrase family protein [Rectinemataceae bacterium]|nr:D-cysteine desulfhydrase family protein [Rectinemataceae bacterium]
MDPATALASLPRKSLAFLPTPLVELPRLSKLLGGPRILVKRDDQTGLAFGGNKTRKLEFLVGAALAEGCDSLITGGAAQSNHCRQTAAAAAAAGLECHLALGGEAPAIPGGNLLLDGLLGAKIHWGGARRKGEDIPRIAESLRAAGRRPYIIPYGGSNARGALGYVEAARELAFQLREQGQSPSAVVFASSSGGTQAGLEVGFRLFGIGARLVAVAIDKFEGEGPSLRDRVRTTAAETAALLGRDMALEPELREDFLGGGYGVVGVAEREAIGLVARTEGLLLDPVYSGRAFAGLLAMIRSGEFGEKESVLFWHTGGGPALFPYAEALLP